MKNSSSLFLLALLSSTALEIHGATVISLSGSDHIGYAALANFNNESTEPVGADYPYYFDTGSGLWVFVPAEKLSSANDYTPFPFAVVNTSTTDGDFNTTNFGTITYDESQVAPAGPDTISLSVTDFTFNLDELSPFNSPRNVGNEFAWDYSIFSSSIPGSLELGFTDGQLTSIDGVMNVGISVRLLGNPGFAFQTSDQSATATYDGTLTFSGNQFAFDVDVTQDVFTLFGPSNNQFVLNRAGSIAAVVPEPTSTLMLLCSGVALALRRRIQSR
ncbi:MAG: PEP-CTERM sorting domain-containing protein [Verrucomicrobiota bacterium]